MGREEQKCRRKAEMGRMVKVVLLKTQGKRQRDSGRDTRKAGRQQDLKHSLGASTKGGVGGQWIRDGREANQFSPSPGTNHPHPGLAPCPIPEPVGSTQQGADEAET